MSCWLQSDKTQPSVELIWNSDFPKLEHLTGELGRKQGKLSKIKASGLFVVLSLWLTYTASGPCQALETEVGFLSCFKPHASSYNICEGCPHLIGGGLSLQAATLLSSFPSKHIRKMLRNDEFQERKSFKGENNAMYADI